MEDCVICGTGQEVFVVGSCNHPVCLRCSARLRKLAKSTLCPVCREDLPQVVATKSGRDFSSFKDLNSLPGNRDLGIRFEDRSLRSNFSVLFEARCNVCGDRRQPDPSFAVLKDHMRREHEQFSCDICEDNLMLYPEERRFYSRASLARHRRVGDGDDEESGTSHRGHPECGFCCQRYFDQDTLYEHLRRKHFWCHICERQNKQLYFADYEGVRDHFAEAHYLCTLDHCASAKFTNVFANKLDLQAHNAKEHSGAKSRSEARQMRQVDVTSLFAYPTAGGGASPDCLDDGATGRSGGRRQPGNHRRHAAEAREDGRHAAASSARNPATEEEELRLGVAMSLSLENGHAASTTGASAQSRKKGKARGSAKSGRNSAAAASAVVEVPAGSSMGMSAMEEHDRSAVQSRAVSSTADFPSLGSAPSADVVPESYAHQRYSPPATRSAGETSAGEASAAETWGSSARPGRDDFPSLSESAAAPTTSAAAGGYSSRLAGPNIPAPAAAANKRAVKGPPPGLQQSKQEEFPSLSSSKPVSSSSSRLQEEFPSLLPKSRAPARTQNSAPPPGFAAVARQSQAATDTSLSGSIAASAPEWTVKKASKKKPGATAGNVTSTTLANGYGVSNTGVSSTTTTATTATPSAAVTASSRPPPGLRPPEHTSTSTDMVGQSTKQSRKRKTSPKSTHQDQPAVATSVAASTAAAKPTSVYNSNDIPAMSKEEFRNLIKLTVCFNETMYSAFTNACGRFYNGDMSASEYYEVIENIFHSNLSEILRPLLAQLPEDKRQALLAAKHDVRATRVGQAQVTAARPARKKPSAWTATSPAAAAPSMAAEAMPTTRQAIGNDFPTLGQGEAVRTTGNGSTSASGGQSSRSADDFPALSSAQAPSRMLSGSWAKR
ncbi:E3 ubiquitin-protein ligase ZNF598-like [Sycon ciliatum]|uniref:E3 ubiquitin-protein ligase ZNF598-like n=1 Tax=Sycon ciliatum TaxID=27933 RepID=UPI0031F5FC78